MDSAAELPGESAALAGGNTIEPDSVLEAAWKAPAATPTLTQAVGSCKDVVDNPSSGLYWPDVPSLSDPIPSPYSNGCCGVDIAVA